MWIWFVSQNTLLYCTYSVDMLDKETIHVLGRTKWDSVRFHHVTQKGAQFKVCKRFAYGVFYLIFSDCSWPSVKETSEKPRRRGTTVFPNCGSKGLLDPLVARHFLPLRCSPGAACLGVAQYKQLETCSTFSELLIWKKQRGPQFSHMVSFLKCSRSY